VKKAILATTLALLAACANDNTPLDRESLENVHQELKSSGGKRFMVSCDDPCDETSVRDAITDHGGRHGPTIGKGRGVEAVLFNDGVNDLRSEGFRVEEDRPVTVGKPQPAPPPAQTTPWGIARIGAPAAWATSTGSGALVAVIDTGRPSHADLAPGACANFTTERGCDDGNGHSTHVSGTIAALDNGTYVVGVAPQATLAFCKALNRNGTGYYSWIISCIDWSVAQGADVINMSLGGSTGSALLEAACDDAANAGTLVIAAAGNEGPGKIGYPAAYASVVSVGATTSTDAIASFSNTNPDVELSAPGASIVSTCKGGGLCTYNGTSMASPHVTGAGAILFSAIPGMTADCARTALANSAIDLGPVGRDTGYGHGLIDVPAALAAAALLCP